MGDYLDMERETQKNENYLWAVKLVCEVTNVSGSICLCQIGEACPVTSTRHMPKSRVTCDMSPPSLLQWIKNKNDPTFNISRRNWNFNQKCKVMLKP